MVKSGSLGSQAALVRSCKHIFSQSSKLASILLEVHKIALGRYLGKRGYPKMSHVRYEAPFRAESRAQRLPCSQHIAPLVTEVAMSCMAGMVEIALVQLDVEPATAGGLARCLSEGEGLRAFP